MERERKIRGTNAFRDSRLDLQLETALGGEQLIIGTGPCSPHNPLRHSDNTNLDLPAVDELISWLTQWRATRFVNKNQSTVVVMSSFTERPTCQKCGDAHPHYKYGKFTANIQETISSITGEDVGIEGIRLTCSRCDFSWLMEVKPKRP